MLNTWIRIKETNQLAIVKNITDGTAEVWYDKEGMIRGFFNLDELEVV